MIRPFEESDDPSQFSCGVPELDTYLRCHALANARAGVSITYVLEDPVVGIGGYVTLAGANIRSGDLLQAAGRHLPRYPLPALLIARLAVDLRRQGRGYGRDLLAFALDEALVARERIGCVGVLVDAKPGARDYYRRLGFVALDPSDAARDTSRMFVPIGTLTDALSGE